jgi:hypothetical protein
LAAWAGYLALNFVLVNGYSSINLMAVYVKNMDKIINQNKTYYDNKQSRIS